MLKLGSGFTEMMAMTPIELERHADFLKRARILKEASEYYLQAAASVEAGEPEDMAYRYAKTAKESIEEAFIEVFQAHKPAPRLIIKEVQDHRAMKIIALAVVVLGVLYCFVAFGPTGNLSSTWVQDDFQKNIAYPKQTK